MFNHGIPEPLFSAATSACGHSSPLWPPLLTETKLNTKKQTAPHMHISPLCACTNTLKRRKKSCLFRQITAHHYFAMLKTFMLPCFRAISCFLDLVIEILMMSVSPDDPQPHSDLTRSPTLQRCQSSSFTFTTGSKCLISYSVISHIQMPMLRKLWCPFINMPMFTVILSVNLVL